MTLTEARIPWDEVVAFYPSQFEEDLGSTFIVEVMEKTHMVPVDLSLNSTRILVSFITLCRALSFGSSINMLRYFFTFQRTYNRLSGKTANDVVHIMDAWPNKNSKAYSKLLLIKSKVGWTFPVPQAELMHYPFRRTTRSWGRMS